MQARLRAKRATCPAVRVGDFVFVAGQVGRTADMQIIVDPEAQFDACFENLRLVLDGRRLHVRRHRRT